MKRFVITNVKDNENSSRFLNAKTDATALSKDVASVFAIDNFILKHYYQRTCSLLEDEVNKQFQYVQWTLFKAKLDGERTPFCECYHDGVPYSRLNGAAKVNAGIDIAYTIARYYNVSVPMILDECESNLSPIAKEGYQQIRLYVSHDERLKIETGAIG